MYSLRSNHENLVKNTLLVCFFLFLKRVHVTWPRGNSNASCPGLDDGTAARAVGDVGVAPTVLSPAGVAPPEVMDGESTAKRQEHGTFRDHGRQEYG